MKIMTSEFLKMSNAFMEVKRTVAGIAHNISLNYQVLEIEKKKNNQAL